MSILGEAPILEESELVSLDANLTGWPLLTSEARDFYHRIRAFPENVAEWRRGTLTLLEEHRSNLPAVRECPDESALRELLDEGISFLREVARVLVLLYGQTPSVQARLLTVLGADEEVPFDLGPEAWQVLSLLGPFRALGLNEPQVPEELRRRLLSSLIPPPLRGPLGLLLGLHAAKVCVADSPQCESCELSRFCAFSRRVTAKRKEKSDAPTVMDLFCGAGGSSLGFEKAGFRVVAGLDLNETALRTFWLNHPTVPDSHVLCEDIRSVSVERFQEILGGRPLDVLIGSPPCQGFSHVGKRCKVKTNGYTLSGDERNLLFHDMVQLALALRPRLFLMENVPGMQSARSQDRSFMELAARRLEEEGGFRTEIWRLNAAAYGVPQDRTRFFLVASGTGCLPVKPMEEYQDSLAGSFRPTLDEALPPIGFDEAVYDLPELTANDGSVVTCWDPEAASRDRRFRRYLKRAKINSASRLLFNHWARYNNARDLELYSILKPGEDSVHAIEKYGRQDLMRYRKDVFDDKYARLRGDRPSKTIVAHLAKDGNGFIHPHQVRSITPREAARIQSFPDDFIFCGSPSDQWMQIGNAVPPLLAKAIAGSFLTALKRDAR